MAEGDRGAGGRWARDAGRSGRLLRRGGPDHNRTIWGLSDGTDGPKGGWTEGDDALEYLLDPEPLGGPGTAPAPDPELFGTYSTVQNLKGTVKAKAQATAKKVSAKKPSKKTAKKSARSRKS